MTTQIKLPALGEGVDSAVVLEVLIHEGDALTEGAAILELETDKATTEVPADQTGTVSAVSVHKGDTVKPGDVLIELREESGDDEAEPAREDGEQKAAPDASGERSDEEAEPGQEGGEQRAAPDASAQPSGGAQPEHQRSERKAAPDASREKSGDDTRSEQARSERKVARGAPDDAATDDTTRKPSHGAGRDASEGGEAPGASPAEKDGAADHLAAPSVRRLARELDVALDGIAGTGEHGQVRMDDLLGYVRDRLHREDASSAHGGDGVEARQDFARDGPVDTVALSPVARAMARNVSRSARNVVPVTQHDEADVTRLHLFRESFDEGKPSWTAIVGRVVAQALIRFPKLNASYDERAQTLVIKRYVHLAVAVDTDHGLFMPVIRNAHTLDLLSLDRAIRAVADRARARALRTEDMTGGSFSLSNLGGFGVATFSPVVSHPQVAILGMAAVREDAPSERSEPGRRLRLPLSLSYDHRVVDGAQGARFIHFVCSALAEPMRLQM